MCSAEAKARHRRCPQQARSCEFGDAIKLSPEYLGLEGGDAALQVLSRLEDAAQNG